MLHTYLRLTWKRVLLIAGAWVLAVIMHNLLYALFFSNTGGDEPFFFILAVIVIPLYFIASLVYSAIAYARKRIQ